jgi:MGT family glycosyltransferase
VSNPGLAPRHIPITETALSHILVCSVPNPGHVGPMLRVAEHLKATDHQVTFSTSEHFRGRVESTGVFFVPFTGKANYDYRTPVDIQEDSDQLDPTVRLVRAMFADTIPDQHEGIQRIHRRRPIDLIVVDTGFFGIYPMLLGSRDQRPAVIGCGVNPMLHSSIDCSWYSAASNTEESRRTVREEHQEVEERFRPVQDRVRDILKGYGLPAMPPFLFDPVYLLSDAFLQFTAEAFEFPRSDMPDTVRFAGSVSPPRSNEFEEPAWWNEMDGSRPVVLVTQGTLANRDFNEVGQPALTGLVDEDALVVVTAGRSDMETLQIPGNARVASFVPFDRLLPKVDVMVTNGGYGAVNQALSLGVPLVVAGETEDKAFVAARVGWAGAGINLKTRYATPEEIREAVRSILANRQYKDAAARLQKEFARYDALQEISRTVEEMLTAAALTTSAQTA